MSVRAAEAYRAGEKPLSKWTKEAILDALATEGYPELAEALEDRKYTLAFLKAHYLMNSSWHHTSCKYNCTDFYSVCVLDDDDDMLKELPETLAEWRANNSETQQKTVSAWRKGKLVWEQWEARSRRWGRYVTRSAEGWVRQEGDWLCVYTGRGKAKKLITRRSLNSKASPRFEKA